MRRTVLLALAMACAAAAAACGPGGAPAAAGGVGTVDVFAAASLQDAFGQVARDFESAHPGSHVRLEFGGSSTLVTQLLQGAPADVFASADEASMQRAVAGGLVEGTPRDFATNRLQIVVPAGNPAAIHSLADLARPGVVAVLCAPQVPCGAYARQALGKAGVTLTPRSEEQDVKGVVTKVALREADAGIVYTTDVLAGRPKVEGVDIPDAENVVARYPVAVLSGGHDRNGGRAFSAFLDTARARADLARFGFGSP